MSFALFRSRLRPLLLLLLLGAVLLLIREVGEQGIALDTSERFQIVARSDSNKLSEKVFGDYRRKTSCSFRAESKAIGDSRRQVPLRVISSQCDIFFGESLHGAGRFLPSEEKRVAALLIVDEIDERSAPKIWKSLHQLRLKFRGFFSLSSEPASLVPGMVIGDESLQSEEFRSVMRLAGLSHLTAVSGANFSIVATLILWLVSWRIPRRGYRIAITSMTLLLFTLLVRPTPSVLRAGVMAAVVLIAQLRGDRRSGFLALAGAVIILLLLDPHQGLDAGFALSVLATSGILLLSPVLSRYMESRWKIPRVLSEIIAIPLSATIFCTPVIIAISGQLSLASVPLNIIVAPLVPLITILGFAVLLLSPFAPIASPLADIATLAASPIPWLARISYYMPIWDVARGWRGGLIALASILFLALIALLVARKIKNASNLKRKQLPILALVLLLATTALHSRDDHWQLFQCDVGQGDALLVRTGDRSAMVIDAGPDPDLIDHCLRDAGIRDISLLVITHLHADHYAGLPGVMRGRNVASWWLSELSAGSAQSIELRSLLHFDPVIVREGDRFEVADVEIQVLAPESGVQGDDADAINNASLVLIVKKDGATILATGDIEAQRQERIAGRYDLREIDIYKVSHHGSSSRSPAFDAELDPKLALISVGTGNPFGHPTQWTLDRLEPARIHRTDLDGAARITWWPLRIR